MDMLYQIQDAPSEKLDATPLDDQEAQYWARRMDTAMTDLELERTRLRVTGMRVSLFFISFIICAIDIIMSETNLLLAAWLIDCLLINFCYALFYSTW